MASKETPDGEMFVLTCFISLMLRSEAGLAYQASSGDVAKEMLRYNPGFRSSGKGRKTSAEESTRNSAINWLNYLVGRKILKKNGAGSFAFNKVIIDTGLSDFQLSKKAAGVLESLARHQQELSDDEFEVVRSKVLEQVRVM